MINEKGGIAQLVERLLCKQDVSGSNPLTSTKERKELKFSTIMATSKESRMRMLEFKTSEKNLENCIISRNNRRI